MISGSPGAAAARCFIPPRDLPRACSSTAGRGLIKQDAEDFRVEEILGFEPDGEGAHAWLLIRKRDTNTQWLAGTLARHAGVARRNVGFSGLKDRAAVTTQWFSVPVEGRAEPDWNALASPQVELLEVTRHAKKLRRGVHKGNRFRIRVQGFEGDAQALRARVGELAAGGAPNYFGEQRFGHDGGNVAGAWEMLKEGKRVRERGLRGLYLSAARSLLFNRVLAERVRDGSWRRALPGEALMLDGTNSVFVMAETDADIEARLAALDLHPTGPLSGSGDTLSRGEALALETGVLAECAEWRDALSGAGLSHARRALRVPLAGLEVDFEAPDRPVLGFALPSGAYATMALRELFNMDSV